MAAQNEDCNLLYDEIELETGKLNVMKDSLENKSKTILELEEKRQNAEKRRNEDLAEKDELDNQLKGHFQRIGKKFYYFVFVMCSIRNTLAVFWVDFMLNNVIFLKLKWRMKRKLYPLKNPTYKMKLM